MSEKQIKPWVKPALEMGPIFAFFAGYIALKDKSFVVAGTEYSGFVGMTALFIPLLALSTFVLWRLTGRLSAMQIMTLVLVVVFGGLTIWLNDERFFKMKPTMIYLMFGGILGFGLMRSKSYLSLVLGEVMPLDATGWRKMEFRMMLFFFGLAGTNEVIWRTMSTDSWVKFKTFGLPIAMFAFFIAQSGLLAKHALETGEKDQAE